MIARLLRACLSPCWFGHAGDPMIVHRGHQLVRECRRCQANLGPVLKGQKFRARKPSKVVTFQAKQRKQA